jgi:hypothetical protein
MDPAAIASRDESERRWARAHSPLKVILSGMIFT